MRIRYIIDKKFQLKYAGRSMVFLAAVFLIVGFIFYQWAFLPLLEKLKNIYPEARLYDILKIVYRNLGISFIFTALIMFIVSIIRSHEIAGPIFRLKSHLRQMSKGDFSKRFKIRENDELKVLVEEVNSLGMNTGLLIEEARSLARRIQAALDELHEKAKEKPEEYKDFVSDLTQLEAEVEQFREILKQYKI
ncbi:MAG: methyl-accepting chemotaxis protein [Candidatus Omnitrophota bacterium]